MLLTNQLDFTKTIFPLALVASESTAIRPIRALGIIVKYTMMAKPIRALELNYPMIQFLLVLY